MEYLFYRLWQLLIGKSEEDMPPFGSMMFLWMLIVFNIGTIKLLLHHFFDFSYTVRNKNEIILEAFITASIVLIFLYFYLFRRRDKIKLKYENESKLKRKVGNIALFTYGILSILLIFVVGNKYPIR